MTITFAPRHLLLALFVARDLLNAHHVASAHDLCLLERELFVVANVEDVYLLWVSNSRSGNLHTAVDHVRNDLSNA